MEEAARTITKAFGLCMTDRTSPVNESRKWGVYYVVVLVLKCYFRVRFPLFPAILTQVVLNKTGQTHIPLQKHPPRSAREQ
jgi:hypothetical protein